MQNEYLVKLLVQLFYAIGSGAGMPIRVAAIDEMHKHYYNAWKTKIVHPPGLRPEERTFLLNCAEAMGRTAAQLAASIGDTAIDKNTMIRAAIRVERLYDSPAAGKYCTFNVVFEEEKQLNRDQRQSGLGVPLTDEEWEKLEAAATKDSAVSSGTGDT